MINLFAHLQDESVEGPLITSLESIVNASKEISSCVRRGALAGVLGSTQDENIHGETQKKLDVISNQMLKDALLACAHVRSLASEEEDTVVAGNNKGEFIVAFDPLDGSSNIDVNGQIGTIFSIYRARENIAANDETQFHQQGTAQLCAGYILYGASTLLIITTGKGTHIFTLDRSDGNFLLTQKNVVVPEETCEFAINMSNQRHWHPAMQNYIQELVRGETGPRGKNFNMRWNASMVGDVHRVICRGGIFLYPSDNRNPKQPAKLRLLYEANPMAMLIENAGGKAWNETQRILEIQPCELHERVAVILGSSKEVNCCLEKILP